MTDQRKDLPPANSPNFLEKVREALSTYLGTRGDLLNRGLTVRDLADAGLVNINPSWMKNGGRIPPINGPGKAIEDAYSEDLTPPPTPTYFNATAAISNLLVECIAPAYTQGHGHARSKLYGRTWESGDLPVFADAQVITEFQGTVAAYATNPATTWHLWLTWVTVDGVESTVPAGGTNGVLVRTGENVALLLEALNQEITSSQLHVNLSTRIDLVDDPETGLVKKVSDLVLIYGDTASAATSAAQAAQDASDAAQAEANAILAAGGAANSATTASTKATESATSATNAAGSASSAATSASTASTSAINAGNSAGAAATNATNAATSASNAGNSATASSSAKVAAESARDSALGSASAAATSASTANTSATDAGSSASAAASSATTASTNAGIASSYASNAATSASNAAGSATTASNQAGIATSAKNAAGDSAAAASASQTSSAMSASNAAGSAASASSTLTNINSVVAGAASAAVQTEAEARMQEDGKLFAQYTVKLDVNGYVSGFGLASTLKDAAPYSHFIFKADQFAFGAPGQSNAYPFVIQTSATTINGVPVPAGVYMDAAYIKNGTITNAKIGNAVIDDAKIANLSAAKLTVGDGTVGGSLKSTTFSSTPGSESGWLINPDGTATFHTALVRGTVYANAGLIGGNTIDSTGMESPGYVAGSEGWRLDSDGSLNATSGSFKGNITGATGTFSGALSAATGTFAGSLSAATGSFAGSLSAATGSFAGSLSAATGSFAGSLSAAMGTFSGTLTASAINAVNTINIGANQVTISNGTNGGASCSSNITIPNGVTARVFVIGVGGGDGLSGTGAEGYSPQVTLTVDGVSTFNYIPTRPYGVSYYSGAATVAISKLVTGPAEVSATADSSVNSMPTTAVYLFANFR